MIRSDGDLCWRRRTRARSGFSLIETLAALTIFSVVIVGVIQGVTIQLRMEAIAENTTRAAMLAQNMVEELRRVGGFEADDQSDAFTGDEENFAWRYQIEDAGLTNLFRVTVTVSWASSHGVREYVVETLMAEHGAGDGVEY